MYPFESVLNEFRGKSVFSEHSRVSDPKLTRKILGKDISRLYSEWLAEKSATQNVRLLGASAAVKKSDLQTHPNYYGLLNL